MKSNQEYRESIISILKAHYRQWRKTERLLRSQRFNRQYKDQKCKSSLAQQAARNELEIESKGWKAAILVMFCRLPEIDAEGQADVEDAIVFCRKLVARKSRRRYMKNQMELVS